jgi:hypothetical protein
VVVGLPGLEPGTSSLSGSAQGSLPQDGTCDLGERCTAGDRWRPLGTARLRWHVDQTWTRHVPPVGAAALRIADLGWQGDPRRLPPTSDPRLAIALLGGALAGSGPGTSPYVGAVPGQRHGYPSALPVQTMRTMVGFLDHMAPAGPITPGCSEPGARRLGEVGFEPDPMLPWRPRSERWTACDLRSSFADSDRL